LDLLEDLHGRIEKWTDFTEKGLEELFIAFMDARQIKLGKIAQPLRVALTGKTASPGIFEVMNALGKEKVLVRIRKAIDHIQKKGNE
jgi:glutamyl-tRNA synthetase